MKALTLAQPYATLVALGEQWIATHSWRTDYRGPLAIHAAAVFPPENVHYTLSQPEITGLLLRRGLAGIPALPLGAVLATAELVDLVPVERLDHAWIAPSVVQRPGRYPLSERDEAWGDYAPGRYAWVLANVVALPEPIPAGGGPGLWEWDGATWPGVRVA